MAFILPNELLLERRMAALSPELRSAEFLRVEQALQAQQKALVSTP